MGAGAVSGVRAPRSPSCQLSTPYPVTKAAQRRSFGIRTECCGPGEGLYPARGTQLRSTKHAEVSLHRNVAGEIPPSEEGGTPPVGLHPDERLVPQPKTPAAGPPERHPLRPFTANVLPVRQRTVPVIGKHVGGWQSSRYHAGFGCDPRNRSRRCFISEWSAGSRGSDADRRRPPGGLTHAS